MKWRKRRKTISDHEDDSGHKMSNVALWHSPHANWRCKLSPQEQCPRETFHWVFSSHRYPTWCSHVHKRRKKSLYTKLKTLVLGFFVAQKYPSVSFSQTWMGKAAFPQTKTWGTENAKGFHIASPTQPEWASGKERVSPSPDVSNKGQPKTQPWWDPTSPLSSGNVNHCARLLQWECCCSCT